MSVLGGDNEGETEPVDTEQSVRAEDEKLSDEPLSLRDVVCVLLCVALLDTDGDSDSVAECDLLIVWADKLGCERETEVPESEGDVVSELLTEALRVPRLLVKDTILLDEEGESVEGDELALDEVDTLWLLETDSEFLEGEALALVDRDGDTE